jgi:sigma-B regulation protein RsbU (phosphoserine phosphatase)
MPEPRAIVGNVARYLTLMRAHRIFGQVDQRALKDLVIRSDLLAYQPDDLLLRQGDPSDTALLITAGEVDVLVDTAQGEVQLARLADGALIGEIGVFTDLPRTASVRAHGVVEALVFGRDDLISVADQSPAVLHAVIAQLGETVGTFNEAVALFTDALAALERDHLDPAMLQALLQPMPELVNFAHTFRRVVAGLARRSQDGDAHPSKD